MNQKRARTYNERHIFSQGLAKMVPKAQINRVTARKTQSQFSPDDEATLHALRDAGLELAARLAWLPRLTSSNVFAKRCRSLTEMFDTILLNAGAAYARHTNSQTPVSHDEASEDLLWLRDNALQLSSAVRVVKSELGSVSHIPHVVRIDETLPRVLAIAQAFFEQTRSVFFEKTFTAFCEGFQETTPLEFHEVGALAPALKLVLLEEIATLGAKLLEGPGSDSSKRITVYIRNLEKITQASWKDVLEPLIVFDKILRRDPAGAYAAMDVESRNIYRERVAHIAQRSDRTELQVAQKALDLALQAATREYSDPRVRERECHIGFFLVSEGVSTLYQRVSFHPTLHERITQWLRANPNEFLLSGIAILTLAMTTVAVWFLTSASSPLLLVLFSLLIFLLPTSQAAVQIMNYLSTNLLPAETLPKLDFSKSIPVDCMTLVAIPTLLLNEKQVHRLVEALEVRCIGNHDPNLHFALVSDLPDSDRSASEDHALVTLCARLITQLNEKYASAGFGSFLLLHRHRLYNPRERGWMGWERKRGKLNDLNQLLCGQYDNFPVKVGDVSILPKLRYVITLDSDTELPRGSAHRMVGALAHPLNRAIIDPMDNIVVAGYGILQPRVGISVECTSRSRLAAIFAGETGLDPYTRAISDVYQDLYSEGTFAGKGIYEVSTMLQVLNHRFPRNALLSHDLIEGAYARAGLASDIIVIEDYPSHYSAYNRRKHRWLRGDWQIAEWLSDRVPNESGASVPNPISLVSRWKILDNLRRSLVEPATFVLLVFGWLVAPQPFLWTVVALCILFVPTWVEFGVTLTRAVLVRNVRVARDAVANIFAANLTTLLMLTLLAHQTLLSLDAVVRAIVRRVITRQRLLEWETAAEAELGTSATPIDRYLDWMPFLAIALGLLIWLIQPHALWIALPILALWASSKLLVLWLNASPVKAERTLTEQDRWLLHKSTLYIWRYFAEFSNDEHNWLIPDNVEEQNQKVMAAVSPTNIGLLLNARQVAQEVGYLTIPELIALTRKTLATMARLSKYRGHLFNWYETRTLEPKPPLFVSSVDSGNLVASLWTLSEGLRDCLRRPLVSKTLVYGMMDHLRVLNELHVLPKRTFVRYEKYLQNDAWIPALLNIPEIALSQIQQRLKLAHSGDIAWFVAQTNVRTDMLHELVKNYLPWLLPEFASLDEVLEMDSDPIGLDVSLQRLPDFILDLQNRLTEQLSVIKNENEILGERLCTMLAQARQNTLRLIEELRATIDEAQGFSSAMDFAFLLDKQRLLLSVGYDAQSHELQPYCYGLLATEPRTAVFIAIAKEDIPQDCWLHLDRPLGSDRGRAVLLSWTGTMFEYLMPSIWMRSYPNTLLDRASEAAVRTQQNYAEKKKIPWGISESACAKRNEAGDYHYEAFGVPDLSLRGKGSSGPLVVSPYATFLALNVDPEKALANLRRMYAMEWFGPYGFYEAADYTNSRSLFGSPRPEIVRSWMVHHLGMSLLSLANFLREGIVQKWFHRDRRVQATELLLQEKPMSQAA